MEARQERGNERARMQPVKVLIAVGSLTRMTSCPSVDGVSGYTLNLSLARVLLNPHRQRGPIQRSALGGLG
jgi:hypothetical protein